MLISLNKQIVFSCAKLTKLKRENISDLKDQECMKLLSQKHWKDKKDKKVLTKKLDNCINQAKIKQP